MAGAGFAGFALRQGDATGVPVSDVPHRASLYSNYGAVPHFGGDNDGIVWKDSATLDGRIASAEIESERANHLNLIGAWNPGTLAHKGISLGR